MRGRTALALAVAAATVVPGSSGAGPATQDPCPGTVTTDTFVSLGSNVLENLLFAHGSVWISDGTAGAVRRFASDRTELPGSTGIPSPGGLALGPDGLIYAGWGNSIGNAMQRTGEARIVRFDPGAPVTSRETYAAGFNMPNGIVFDAAGNLYVSNDFDAELKVIPRANPSAWSVINNVWGANGLVVDAAGENLYAAITFDQRSPIERISLPSYTHETAVQLTLGAASLQPAVHTNGDPDRPLLGVKGLDDMTRDDAGFLYPVANGTGELLRVDPATGDACLLLGGMRNPSSVRIVPEDSGFADGDPKTVNFFITEFSGLVRRVIWTP